MHGSNILPPSTQEPPRSLATGRQTSPESLIYVSLRPSFRLTCRGIFRAWQRNSKRAAVAFFAFESDVAALSFDGPTSDRQSKAGATPFPSPCFVHPVEALKDIRLMFAGNSRYLVDHVEEHPLVSLALYPDENPAFRGRILNCVIQQIEDGLTKNQTIDRHKEVCVTLDFDPLPFFLRQDLYDGTGLLCEEHNGNVFPLQLDVPRVGTGKCQQALRQPRQAIHLFQHASDHIAILHRTPLVLEGHLANASHRRQRGAQFVGGVRREAAQLIECGLQSRASVVENGAELP